MNFLVAAMVTMLVASIVLLTLSAIVIKRVPQVPVWLALSNQVSAFGIGASATSIAILLALNKLISIGHVRQDFWGNLASGICLILVVMGFGLVLCGGFGAAELAQRFAARGKV